MITWFTRFSFDRTAEDLTTQTLGWQLEEFRDVWSAMIGSNDGEIPDNHPVLRMWEGYEFALGTYGMALCDQFTRVRRQLDSTLYDVYYDIQDIKKDDKEFVYEAPPWFKDADVCRSHRSNLMRREPSNYKRTWPKTPENMPYLWPFIDDSPEGYSLMVSKAERELLRKGERALPKPIAARVKNL